MKVYYDRQNKRLVCIGESASPEFWDRLLDTKYFQKNIESGKEDRFIIRTLRKYLPGKRGRILEGGCGEGRIVYGMHAHGYRSVGVDTAKKTIARTKELFPELDVRVGDVRKLPFSDNYFVGYWSIGVIEHFWDGYQSVIKEMQRVLAKGGYVFLSFPYMSPLRKLKAKLGLYREYNGQGRENFYQFILDLDAVTKDFEVSGFRLLEKTSSAGLKGFKDEASLLKPVLQKLFSYKGGNLLIRGIKFILDQLFAAFAGHTIFIVLRKEKQAP